MALPQYIKDAQNNYNAKFDIIQLKLPQGTKNRIKAIIGEDGSMAAYCKQAVLTALESDGDLQKETSPETQEVPKSVPVEEVPQERAKAEFKPITAEENEEFLKLIAEKKAEQDRRTEELRQQEEVERQEKERQTKELIEHVERLRRGEELPEDAEKEQLRQEIIAKADRGY